MAKMHCQAIVSGEVSGSDGVCLFDADDDPFQRPVDEIVEVFMQHIQDQRIISGRDRHELNSAMKNKEKQVVTAVGNLVLKNGTLPFVKMISRTA